MLRKSVLFLEVYPLFNNYYRLERQSFLIFGKYCIVANRGLIVVAVIGTAAVLVLIFGADNRPTGAFGPQSGVGRGTGAQPDTIRVCTTSALRGTWTIPALAVFENAGILVGALTDAWQVENYKANTADRSAALITIESAVVTAEKPCVNLHAKMLYSDSYKQRSWPSSRMSDVWDFQYVLGYPVKLLAQPNELGMLRGSISLRAVTLGPIREASELTHEAALALEPENPLNRIPGDLAIAEGVHPPAGGNLRICLSINVKDENYSSVKLPPGLIFESYGRLVGSERDPQVDPDNVRLEGKQSSAVVLLRLLTLTKAKPCGVATVRTVLSSDWPWLFPLIRDSDHLHLQALKMRGRVGDGSDLPGTLGDVMIKGLLNATPIADIGEPLDISREN